MGRALLTHQTSFFGCVSLESKVVAPIRSVVKQAQCNMGDPRLLGRAAHFINSRAHTVSTCKLAAAHQCDITIIKKEAKIVPILLVLQTVITQHVIPPS